MTWSTLLRRNLTHFWRTNLAVVAAVAVAVAVLAGALLVGDSVRASLRDLVLLRLGETSFVITSENFFRDGLAQDLSSRPEFGEQFRAAVPLIALDGAVTHEPSRRRASRVFVYGVDERFWSFHAREVRAPEAREALLSASLAAELGAAPGDAILVRVERPSAVPVESMHSHKDDLGRTLRLEARETLAAEQLGEFSVRPQQGSVRAVFVSLARLQRDLDQAGKVNGLLVSEPESRTRAGEEADAARRKLESLLRDSSQLADLGVRIVPAGRPDSAQVTVSIESDRVVLDDRIADAARAAAADLRWDATSVFAYLANTIRIGEREIPYSLVAALDGEEFASLPASQEAPLESEPPPIWLNDWAWRDLGARLHDPVKLVYYIWQEGGFLETRTTEFSLRGRVPMEGLGGDRSLAPTYPGISESRTVSNWDPPFPVDLSRIRPRDEDYWEKFRAAPKAFVPLAIGQRLWETRYGKLTAVRLRASAGTSAEVALAAARDALRSKLDPVESGIAVYAARAAGTEASRGAVDFSVYFLSFSFFLVISAVLLTGLFFRLGIEQRLREIGLLEAVGFSSRDVRAIFLREGLALAALGSLLGAAGAAGFGALMIHGLRTWWVGAVGTTFLRLEIAPVSLLAGVAGGIVAAALCIVWTLAGLRELSPRSLVAGSLESGSASRAARWRTERWGAAAAALGFALLATASFGWLDPAIAFFVAGGLMLVALLSFQWGWLARPRGAGRQPGAATSVVWMGARNASWRPGRSLLSIALVASATFVLVAVDAFRRDARADALDPHSGTGGFPLLAESLLPIPYDANTRGGREGLNLSEDELETLEGVKFFSFRVRAGEDASCLNLYQPRNPRVLGVPEALIESGRFRFQSSLAGTPEERENPWQLLNTELADGAVPAFADANTLTYILHRKLGEEVVLEQAGREVRLRLVGALADSLFQSELLVSERNFLRAFPNEPGYRFFLLDAPPERAQEIAAALEEGLRDYGFDVSPAAERLEAFHRVENTYISTFQALGGLGLLLGTLGLAAVMVRNVFERRRELALLRAVGYRPADLATLTLAENSILLFGGLLTGIVSAGLAIFPALAERGGVPGGGSLAVILAGVVLAGLAASLVAVAAVVRAPLLGALRSE
jgi:ABC-type antimicrobial peptide transport system permease subunit